MASDVFCVTHLGWQSWLLHTADGALLIDPLLGDSVGRGFPPYRQTLPSWPPRRLDLAAFPPLSAVVITHEHEDHLDLPSLARVDRSVPVWLSDRTSAAARTILPEMGFRVGLFDAGDSFRAGPFEIQVPSSLKAPTECFEDEWDVLPLLVCAREGNGNFFTNVDAPVTRGMLEVVERAQSRDGREVETVTAIGGELRVGRSHEVPPPTGHAGHGAPRRRSAGGADPLAALAAGGAVPCRAGNTVVMEEGRLRGWRYELPFVATLPQAEWPPPPVFWPDPEAAHAPVGACHEPTAAELHEIQEGLCRIAEWMYGGPIFRFLLSCERPQRGRRAPHMILVLRTTPDDAYGFEYQPRQCAFVPIETIASEAAIGQVACWAGDLLALLRGQVEPRTVLAGFREAWAPSPPYRMPFSMLVLWPYFHPLRHPEACLRQYRRLLARSQGEGPAGVAPADESARLGSASR